jgi:hypothetical protein
MFRKRLMSQTMLAVMLSMALVGQPVLIGKAFAAGGDFSLNFTAAAPFTYDHDIGGGTFDNRTVGKNDDIVESLEGGDFDCGDLVSFLTRIKVDPAATGTQTIDLKYVWTADTTGQSGIALDTMVNAVINRPPNVNVIPPGVAEGPGGTDSGNSPDDGGVLGDATIVATDYTQTTFSKGAEHSATVRVTDLDPTENLVLRFELELVCDGRRPSGNMQVKLDSAVVVGTGDIISVGKQTIPFQHVGDVKCTDPKDCQPPPPPK